MEGGEGGKMKEEDISPFGDLLVNLWNLKKLACGGIPPWRFACEPCESENSRLRRTFPLGDSRLNLVNLKFLRLRRAFPLGDSLVEPWEC